jgi:hypothetical protein
MNMFGVPKYTVNSRQRKPTYSNLRTPVRYFNLTMIFHVLPRELIFCLLATFDYVLFLAVKTLVTLSNKEKESLKVKAGPSASGMGVDSMLLEPGTISHRLICL